MAEAKTGLIDDVIRAAVTCAPSVALFIEERGGKWTPQIIAEHILHTLTDDGLLAERLLPRVTELVRAELAPPA